MNTYIYFDEVFNEPSPAVDDVPAPRNRAERRAEARGGPDAIKALRTGVDREERLTRQYGHV